MQIYAYICIDMIKNDLFHSRLEIDDPTVKREMDWARLSLIRLI